MMYDYVEFRVPAEFHAEQSSLKFKSMRSNRIDLPVPVTASTEELCEIVDTVEQFTAGQYMKFSPNIVVMEAIQNIMRYLGVSDKRLETQIVTHIQVRRRF